jgi:hypothetical protein
MKINSKRFSVVLFFCQLSHLSLENFLFVVTMIAKLQKKKKIAKQKKTFSDTLLQVLQKMS